jgi:uncharacterized protein YegJ (DUF2314 family)
MTHDHVPPWRLYGRLTGLLLLLAGAVSANSNALALTRDISVEHDGIKIDFTDAQIAARQHLDHFFRMVLDEDGVGQMGAAVRVAFPRQNGRIELIWITPFQQENGQYIGILHNSEASEHSEVLTFKRDQVVDWSFAAPDGRLYGNFATRLFLQTLPTAQAAKIASILSETPAPAEWLP